MMFFKFNQNSSAQVEAVLNKEDVTLRDLMDEEDTLQECRVQNKKLIDFLVRPEIVDELVTLITCEPPCDVEERLRYKYPNIACELLTCDVPAINERLAGEPALLGKLHAFLESDKPLDPLLASFWSKTMGVLISRNGDQNWYSYQFTCLQVLEFFKSKANFISLLLKHLGTSAVMDATLKFITQVEGVDIRQNVLNWLDSQTVIQSLVSLLRPCVDSERQCNAAQLLCDIIRMCRESLHNCTERRDPDPILSRIESPETVSQLLDNMLGGEEKSESSIVGGISVLLALLDCSRPSMCAAEANVYGGGTLGMDSTHGEEKQPHSKVVVSTTAAIVPWVKQLHDLLLNPPHKPPVRTTIGILDPPLGNTRLQAAKLFAALISINNVDINKELVELGTVEVLLDLFFNYTWNNFLHFQVEQCLAFALNTELKPASKDDNIKQNILLESIFIRCKLLQRILEAWDGIEDNVSNIQGRRKGYMGHLVNIANHVVHASEKEPLGSFIKDWVTKDTVAAWEAFIANALAETNKTNDILLAGVHPAHTTSEDDAQDYRDIPFPADPALTQVFSDYQMNQSSPQFIENYGYHDDEFNDGDEISSSTDSLTSMTFTVSEEEMDEQAEMFRQVCQKKLGRKNTWNQNRQWDDTADSSSDEEERSQPDMQEGNAETDPWVCGEAVEGAGDAPVAVDAGNPWAISTSAASCFPTSESAGWANFDSVGFADFEANFNPEGSCDLDSEVVDGSLPTSNCDVFTTNMPSASALDQGGAVCSNGNTLQEPRCASEDEEVGHSDDGKLPPKTIVLESCADNANKNQQGEENLQLLDNYRFLSMQGMISERSAGESEESHGTRDMGAESNGPVEMPMPAANADDVAVPAKCKLEEVRAVENTSPSVAMTSNGPV